MSSHIQDKEFFYLENFSSVPAPEIRVVHQKIVFYDDSSFNAIFWLMSRDHVWPDDDHSSWNLSNRNFSNQLNSLIFHKLNFFPEWSHLSGQTCSLVFFFHNSKADFYFFLNILLKFFVGFKFRNFKNSFPS